MRRLLMYSQDGMGLGHLRRTWNIAEQVLLREPNCDILILADSPATSLVPAHFGVDIVKLPTIVKTGSGSWNSTAWKNGSLTSGIERIVNLRAKLILDAFCGFDPDTVLVDHMPVGALGELKPLLDRAVDGRRRSRLFLGLRDVLDSPAVIRRVWTKLSAYDYLHRYEAVLIYGRPDMYDASAEYGLTPNAREVVFCNYVAPGLSVREARASSEPYILMMGGGGRDAFPLALAFLDAAPELCRELGMGGVLLTGPNMLPSDRDALVARAMPPVVVQSSFCEADDWIRNAAVVVTLAGYNSLCEIMKWRRKALVVPRPGPSAEQRTRSRLFAERSLIRELEVTALTRERLIHEVLELVRTDAIPEGPNIPPLDGASRAASVLLHGVSSRPRAMAGVGEAADSMRPSGAGTPESGEVAAHIRIVDESSVIGAQ